MRSDASPRVRQPSPEKGVVSIPLPPEYNARAISGDPGIMGPLMDIFLAADRVLTTVRVEEAAETIYTGQSTLGEINLWMNAHSEASLSFYALLAVYGLYNAHTDHVEQKRKDKEKQNIYKHLKLAKEKAIYEKKRRRPTDIQRNRRRRTDKRNYLESEKI